MSSIWTIHLKQVWKLVSPPKQMVSLMRPNLLSKSLNAIGGGLGHGSSRTLALWNVERCRFMCSKASEGNEGVKGGAASEARDTICAPSTEQTGEGEPLSALGTGARTPERLLMAFTCTVCNVRSARMFSKKSYEEGVVIITCPGCKNNHLIADRLGWFDDESIDIESIMREKGEEVVFIKDIDGGGTFQLADRNQQKKEESTKENGE
mmetsp:Transcript_14732/g.20628  ORF Transcript_14732/g.20628 Transcript_14732/m.20628 type:complete len:208 (+) Transcript_14732:96-719(+)|eukprot:CAMPEP_0184478732 /NCGR_PEP_ID=MMETSP0113_2-20130426/678_1 /TAXON_ID=91329 /ORGANISM="Norrisiella sphaerica, Strain BC52" /LENGTH=207 /DNA_ID=CAMNT_0026856621 /DNA_START=71 /DNA_END=694 /DNA_ORIENTATION=+